MSMSKQDFIALADVLRSQRVSHGWTDKQINELAIFCASQNPRFDRARWLGYIAGTCGPSGGRVKGK